MEVGFSEEEEADVQSVFSSFSCITADPPDKRLQCEKCRRPLKTCWCASLPSEPIQITTTVFILQHPYEETRSLQTGLMLKLGLQSEKCHILKGKRFSLKRHLGLAAAVADPNTLLLWPGPSAESLQNCVSERAHSQNLIVLDGTWHQARGMYNQNKFLHSIKQVQLTDTGLSNYVIRTQPSNACLSTVETVAIAIDTLENRPDIYEAMMRPLQALCAYQLDHGAVIHHSKQHLIENGLYVKQLPKPTDVPRKTHQRPQQSAPSGFSSVVDVSRELANSNR